MSLAEQTRRDPLQEEPLSILASGGYGVTANAVARAISEFVNRFLAEHRFTMTGGYRRVTGSGTSVIRRSLRRSSTCWP